ncbi:hypothetical protein BH11BAC2_BH11BAC2_17980 [soil metagenome]
MKQLIIAALLILIVVAFAVQNAAEMTIHFMVWELNMSMALVLVITLLLGILFGILVSTPRILKYRREIARLSKQVPDKSVL